MADPACAEELERRDTERHVDRMRLVLCGDDERLRGARERIAEFEDLESRASGDERVRLATRIIQLRAWIGRVESDHENLAAFYAVRVGRDFSESLDCQ